MQTKPARMLLTTLGIAFGISLYVAIAIINASTRDSFKESIESISGKAQLTITGGPSGFAEALLEPVRTTPGVKTAVPMIESRAFFEGAKASSEGLQIMGIDLLQETSVRSYKATDQKIIDDPLTFLNQPDSIVLTVAFAKKRGLKIDSKIKLATAQGTRPFVVRGLLEPEGVARAYGGSLAIMDIDGARVSFGKENKLDRIDIVPEKNIALDEVKKNLEKTLGSGFTIERPETKTEQMDRVVKSYQLILTFFSTLALLVGLFLVMNSVAVSIAERRREIGTLRALGGTRVSMVALFVSEVFGIGLVGTLLGCGGGVLLSRVLVNQITTSISSQFQTQVHIARLEFTMEQFLFTMAIGVASSLIAALIPATRAASVHPLESMKRHQESTEAQDDRRGMALVALGFLMLVWITVSMSYGFSARFGIFFDLSDKFFAVMGAALFGPFLVFLLIRLFHFIFARSRLTVIRLAFENLLKSRKRTTSNLMALMVGLFLVTMISTVRNSFHDTLVNWLDEVFLSDIIVSSSGRLITADVQPIDEKVLTELPQVEGIQPIEKGRGQAVRFTRLNHHGDVMVIKAYDHFPKYYQNRNIKVIGSDRVSTVEKLYETNEPRMIASENFIKKYNKKIGESVTLDTPSGAKEFKIVGMAVDFASPNGVFYLNRAVYRKLWNDPTITSFTLNMEPGFTFDQVRANIDKTIGRKWNLVAISNKEFKRQMEETIEQSFAYTRAIGAISLLVGLLGLLNTMLISVMERTREIGVLRAIGCTRTQISSIIFSEAILQGLFGGLIAMCLGTYVGKLFVEHSLSTSLGWYIDFYFPKDSVVTTLITGVVVAGLAGILPARRAAALPITEALDYD